MTAKDENDLIQSSSHTTNECIDDKEYVQFNHRDVFC